jgi:predicted nucleotidyltransferase
VSEPKTLSQATKDELAKFEVYLKRRAERPDESVFVTYAEVYGEVVFEDKEAARAIP